VLEKEMEDLIATHPDEFFPRHGLTLEGRQGTFPEFGRYDLLFRDGFGKRIIMELKAVPASYEHATQLARYNETLRANNVASVWMWLVAPSIPRPVREFLDQVGIQYSEIHEAEFRKVAAGHGYTFASEVLQAANSAPSAVLKASMTPSVSPGKLAHRGTASWFFNTDEGEPEGKGAWAKMLANSCIALWYPQDKADPEKKLAVPIAGERVFFYLNKTGFIATALFTEEPPVPDDTVFPKGTPRAYHRRVSGLIEISPANALKRGDVAALGGKLQYIGPLYRIADQQLADKMLEEFESRARR
jgi:Endonuclease NucS